MRLSEYDTSNRFTVVVKSNTALIPPTSSEDVRELVLSHETANLDYQVGQNIGVLIPGPHYHGHDVHFRLYTIADPPSEDRQSANTLSICVKRCDYVDEYSGERYPGIASNYLCDRQPGDKLEITGPYGLPFNVPADRNADLILIGMGTGIAPFRALVKHIYQNIGGWQGQIRLFYGSKTGIESLYLNDARDDFANYYDERTFQAIKALSPRPIRNEPAALDEALKQHKEWLWQMLNKPNTHIFIAGLEIIQHQMDSAFSIMAGNKEQWQLKKAELIAGKRWSELIY